MNAFIRLFLSAAVGFVIGRLWFGAGGVDVQRAAHGGSLSTPANAYPSDEPKGHDNAQKMLRMLVANSTIHSDLELADTLQKMDDADFREFAAHIKELLSNQAGPLNEEALSAVFDRWFAVSSPSAKDWAKQFFVQPIGDFAFSLCNVMECADKAAVKADPEWALEQLLLKNPPRYIDPNRVLMSAVAEQNPTLAKQWMDKLESTPLRNSVRAGYVLGLAKSDPLAAINCALSEQTFQQMNLVDSVMREVAKNGTDATQQTLARISDKALHSRAVIEALGVLASETTSDPIAFLRDELGPGLEKFDPSQLIEGTDNREWTALVERDPIAAANWALMLPEGNSSKVLHSIIEVWSSLDMNALNSWVEKTRTESAGNGNASMSSVLADVQLIAANKLFEDGNADEAIAKASNLPGNPSDSMFSQLVFKATGSDPSLAAKLVANVPDDRLRQKAEKTIGKAWVGTDPEAAADWIRSLPQGRDHDSATVGLVDTIQEEDPAQASVWVEEIGDQNQRQSAAQSVLYAWNGRDSEAAREWFKALTGVDAGWKEKILRRIR